MFPFGNSSNGNPILHCSSVPPLSFLGLNGNQILLHQHDLDHHLPYLAPNGHLIDNNNSVMFATNSFINNKSNKIKKAVKKDRHSKILTSQGHRDRRVRLSIGVARKFFDLQDMLGFDKPSKTLDWLFTKSKLAIEELSNESKKSTGTPSSVNNTNSECDEDIIVPAAAASDELTKRAKQERESRAKARARARERTIKKIWTQIQPKSLVVLKDQTKMEQIMNLSAPNRESAASHYNNCTRNWGHDDVNPTTMSSMAAATICCTSSLQVQKAWDTYQGSQL